MNLLRIGKYIILSLLLIVLSVVGYKIYSDKKGFSGPLPKVITETTSSAPTVTPPREVVNLQDSFAQVAAIVKPAVVNISAIQIRDGAADPHQFY